MDIDKNKTPIRFVANLRHDVVGLPVCLVWHLANIASVIYGTPSIPPFQGDSQASSQFRNLQRVREFVQANRFRFPNNDISECRAYLTSDEHIELSDLYRQEVKDTLVRIVSVKSQQSSADRWSTIKRKIDSIDITGVIAALLKPLDDRDIDIVCGFYGLLGEEKKSAVELATSLGLSRARVYQIVKRFEADSRQLLMRYGRTPRYPEHYKDNLEHITDLLFRKHDSRPAAVLSRSIQELGHFCFDLDISIAVMLDYIELRYPNEFLFLKQVFPPFRSYIQFCDYLETTGDKYVVPDVVDPEALFAHYFTEAQCSEIRNLDVVDLPFPERVIRSLHAAGFHKGEQLLSVSALDLYQTPHITRETFSHILIWSSRLDKNPEQKHPQVVPKPTTVRRKSP